MILAQFGSPRRNNVRCDIIGIVCPMRLIRVRIVFMRLSCRRITRLGRRKTILFRTDSLVGKVCRNLQYVLNRLGRQSRRRDRIEFVILLVGFISRPPFINHCGGGVSRRTVLVIHRIERLSSVFDLTPDRHRSTYDERLMVFTAENRRIVGQRQPFGDFHIALGAQVIGLEILLTNIIDTVLIVITTGNRE